MNKFLSLLKVTLREDFNRRSTSKSAKGNPFGSIGKIILVLFILACVLSAIATYAFLLGQQLAPLHLTYVMIGLFSIVPVFIIFIDGIWRAGAVLYDSKDNDMLLSMPIKKSVILFTRFIRFLAFEYIWTLLIMVPVVAVYAYFEKTDLHFYISTILYTLTIPIIPTMLACIVGYVTKAISSRFKRKNLVLSLLFMLIIVGLYGGIIYLQNHVGSIVGAAQSINDIFSKIYYPLGIYIDLITVNFNVTKILLLILFEIALVAVFTYIFSINYYKIISRLSEHTSKGNYKITSQEKNKVKKPVFALFGKELARYTSSPIYVMNTAFGTLIMLIGVIYFIFKMPTQLVIEGQDFGFLLDSFPVFIMLALTFIFGVSTTTASSISLEGKNLWITKSLPVKETTIFLAKMMLNWLILWPVGVIGVIAFAIKLKLALFEILFLLAGILVMGLFTAIFGLVVNLTFPKLEFKSDQQVVKQSISTFVSIFGGIVPTALILIVGYLLKVQDYYAYGFACIGVMAVVVAVLWAILNTYGVRKFRELG